MSVSQPVADACAKAVTQDMLKQAAVLRENAYMHHGLQGNVATPVADVETPPPAPPEPQTSKVEISPITVTHESKTISGENQPSNPAPQPPAATSGSGRSNLGKAAIAAAALIGASGIGAGGVGLYRYLTRPAAETPVDNGTDNGDKQPAGGDLLQHLIDKGLNKR